MLYTFHFPPVTARHQTRNRKAGLSRISSFLRMGASHRYVVSEKRRLEFLFSCKILSPSFLLFATLTGVPTATPFFYRVLLLVTDRDDACRPSNVFSFPRTKTNPVLNTARSVFHTGRKPVRAPPSSPILTALSVYIKTVWICLPMPQRSLHYGQNSM